MSLTACRLLKRPDKVCTRQHDNPGSEPQQGAGNEGRTSSFIFPPPSGKGKCAGQETLLKMKREACEELFFFTLFSLSFFDMQTLLSHRRSEIVSQVAMGGWCDDGNPISI